MFPQGELVFFSHFLLKFLNIRIHELFNPPATQANKVVVVFRIQFIFITAPAVAQVQSSHHIVSDKDFDSSVNGGPGNPDTTIP